MRKIWRTLLAAAGAVTAVTAAVALPAGPASAAALTEVTGFGTNPTGLRMHLYVPDKLAASPGLLVAVHYCTGSGPALFSGTEYKTLADQYGFVVIYPSATRSGNCFDVSTASALSHNGNSDPVGIVSMVKYVQQRYKTDVNRTFVAGGSSGAMMTNVLLGDYPDVFAAGSATSGVPFGCFATGAGDPTNPANQAGWNTTCAHGQVVKTPQAWGDLVRAAYPGYTGRRPRVQVFHGTADTTLYYPNFGEEIKQWTNVLGVSQTPVFTDTPQSGWTRTRYGSTAVQAPVEGVSLAGVGHGMPASLARLSIAFFGLDTAAPTTPATTAPTMPSTSPPSSPETSAPATGPTSTAPPGDACKVTAAINAWNTGLTANLAITNTSSTTVDGWSLSFTLPSGQAITNSWNAAFSPGSGTVTAKNTSYNGQIAPGETTTIGYQATHTGTTVAPTAFALNGAACTTG